MVYFLHFSHYRSSFNLLKGGFSVLKETKSEGTKEKKLKPEILLNCLDVLCRANVSVAEENPHLASEIIHAIESLAQALQSEEVVEKPDESLKKDGTTKYTRDYKENVVDVLTNEVLYSADNITKG